IIRQEAEKMGVKIAPEEENEKWEDHKKRYGDANAFKSFLDRAGTTEQDVREQFDQNLLRERVFSKVSESASVSQDEVKDFFGKNKPRKEDPERGQASHILIRMPQPPNATDEQKAAAKKRADEVLKKVKQKPGEWGALAKEYGEDPTKDHGGDLGYFSR